MTNDNKADAMMEHVRLANEKAGQLTTLAKVARGVLQAQGSVNAVDANAIRRDISIGIVHLEAALRILNELPIKGDASVH